MPQLNGDYLFVFLKDSVVFKLNKLKIIKKKKKIMNFFSSLLLLTLVFKILLFFEEVRNEDQVHSYLFIINKKTLKNLQLKLNL